MECASQHGRSGQSVHKPRFPSRNPKVTAGAGQLLKPGAQERVRQWLSDRTVDQPKCHRCTTLTVWRSESASTVPPEVTIARRRIKTKAGFAGVFSETAPPGPRAAEVPEKNGALWCVGSVRTPGFRSQLYHLLKIKPISSTIK